MKIYTIFQLAAALLCALPTLAQEDSSPSPARSRTPSTKSTGDYASDIVVVSDAQNQALEQARQMLKQGDNVRDRTALQAAITEMERAETDLEAAKKTPAKLPAAVAAEQAAYQALLKVAPREYRMTQSRNGSQGGAGQPNQQQMDQLDLKKDENRYETESQATPEATAKQREQTETADRLKQLAQRQQDLNERLRELQTALQAAKTEEEKADIQQQLKRLRDEERQMLSDVDELRQKLEQSPNAASQAKARQQLEQTRSDVQNAAEQLEKQSVSQALAAGSRAEQNLQNLQDNFRKQTASQFTQQMRDLRNQAHELSRQEEDIARQLDELNNTGEKSLDNTSQRQQLGQQMNRQEGALTNLLANMRTVTEQAETTEPLLSKQLYDIIRRADQMHTDNQLDVGAQLVDRGFLPQASEAERGARTNIDELRQSVDRAAESVLGSEADALKYAQKELDDLSRQVERELSAGTNGGTNAAPGKAGSIAGQNGNRGGNTNAVAGAGGEQGAGEAQPGGEQGAQTAQQNSGQNGSQNDGQNQSQNASQGNQPQPSQQGNASSGGGNSGNNQANSNQQSQQASPQANGSTPGQDASASSAQNGTDANGGNGNDGREQLREIARQIGAANSGANGGLGGLNGPITGNNYVDWTERLRGVEQVLDSQDLRNQLATVRERVGVLRGYYRQNGYIPTPGEMQTEVLEPLALARAWVNQELSRAEDSHSLAPLDRDPVPDKYSELVRKYYEKLGGPQ